MATERIVCAAAGEIGDELARKGRLGGIGAHDWHGGAVGFKEKVLTLIDSSQIETKDGIGNDRHTGLPTVDNNLRGQLRRRGGPARRLWRLREDACLRKNVNITT